jgi:hypothetical protein
MKNIFKRLFLLIVLVFIGSCNNSKSNSTLSLEKQQVNSQVKYDFTGVWVRKDYIENLKKTHSPYKSFDYLENVSSLLIKKGNTDVIEVGLSLGNHEGSSTKIMNKKDGYFIQLSLEGKDEWIPIFLDQNIFFKYEDKKYEFIKVLNEVPQDASAGIGIQAITNKVLLGGKIFSNADISENISFKENGTISNFKNYKTYEVITDFMTDPDPMDFMILKSATEETGFHFKLTNENLTLYKFNEEIDDFELKYTLLIN